MRRAKKKATKTAFLRNGAYAAGGVDAANSRWRQHPSPAMRPRRLSPCPASSSPRFLPGLIGHGLTNSRDPVLADASKITARRRLPVAGHIEADLAGERIGISTMLHLPVFKAKARGTWVGLLKPKVTGL